MKGGNVEILFTEDHTHDQGSTAIKIAFLPNDINNDLFGDDNFANQNNHNIKVMANKRTIQERGAKLLTMDFSTIDYPFTPNSSYEIKVAYEPFVYTPFWMDYQMCSLLPLVYFIY